VILVDSSVWIDHFNGHETEQVTWLQAALGEETEAFAIGDLIMQEVLQGFRLKRHFELALDALTRLPCLPLGGQARCVAAAANYRQLRARGITIRSGIDVLIATFCIETGMTLLHDDRDFDSLQQHLGLQVVQV
jgi:predicted nucleic acid-binding protein